MDPKVNYKNMGVSWGFHSHKGTPIAGAFISWKISIQKWMMAGGTPYRKPPYLSIDPDVSPVPGSGEAQEEAP